MISQPVRLRSALASDAEAICDLLAPYAAEGTVLPRTLEETRSHAANFIVAVDDDRAVGAVALRDFGDGLQEIRSLVVHLEYKDRGLGSQLILGALDLARRRQAARVFALTLRPSLFERLGFALVDRHTFPQKVWHDCAKCPKQDCCDEVGVLIHLQEDSSRQV